jgi:hypothetical protein
MTPHRKGTDRRPVPAPELAPPDPVRGDAGTYPSLCFSCGSMVMLSPADAVVAEARLCVGDVTLVWCPSCLRREAERIADELDG